MRESWCIARISIPMHDKIEGDTNVICLPCPEQGYNEVLHSSELGYSPLSA